MKSLGTSSLEKRGQVRVIFTDIRKAFDTIDHNLLLRELEFLGLGNTLTWLKFYLTNRKQFVKFSGTFFSHLINLLSSLPQ